MNLRVLFAAGAMLSALLVSTNARAMAILDFAKLNDDDASTYVVSLVEGAAKMLRAHGQPDQAKKAVALFKDPSKTGGVNQLALNLKTLNATNKRNAINPNNRIHAYDVEDAMALTLKDNGMIVPVSYLETINKDFRPIGPPRGH